MSSTFASAPQATWGPWASLRRRNSVQLIGPNSRLSSPRELPRSLRAFDRPTTSMSPCCDQIPAFSWIAFSPGTRPSAMWLYTVWPRSAKSQSHSRPVQTMPRERRPSTLFANALLKRYSHQRYWRQHRQARAQPSRCPPTTALHSPDRPHTFTRRGRHDLPAKPRVPKTRVPHPSRLVLKRHRHSTRYSLLTEAKRPVGHIQLR